MDLLPSLRTLVRNRRVLCSIWGLTLLASAARFSPDDKFSRHRLTIKKRYGILLTQQPAEKL